MAPGFVSNILRSPPARYPAVLRAPLDLIGVEFVSTSPHNPQYHYQLRSILAQDFRGMEEEI